MRSDRRSLFFLVGHCYVQPTGIDILVAYNRDRKIESAQSYTIIYIYIYIVRAEKSNYSLGI